MNLTSHLEMLAKKEQKLDDKIHDAYVHHASEEEMHSLKKERLRVKDEIRKNEQAA